MLINQIRNAGGKPTFTHKSLETISPTRLRSVVEELAYPRHYVAQRSDNERACYWICNELKQVGYDVRLQGEFDNIIALPQSRSADQPLILLGAHYDTVETTPGADDNNSAIAVCLEAARVLADLSLPVAVAVFNREEDGLLGSREFVANGLNELGLQIQEAHIFEMVGYFVKEPGSQSVPNGLPIKLRDVGDFLGLISNQSSNKITARLEKTAQAISMQTPLTTLKTYLGVEKLVSDLLRSDHVPFWENKIPAVMWTDTSNFRNPHYHAPSDLPETLDYEAMADVTRLIVGDLTRNRG